MKITIYLPTKNRVGLLNKAVKSVLEQTYSNLELLVINDGSTDDTNNFLQAKAAADARLKVIYNSVSLGAPGSRNMAIRQASGEFVTGLDDDDQFEPYRLETFVSGWESLSRTGITLSCLYAQDKWMVNGEVDSETSRQGSTSHDAMPSRNHVGNQIFAPKAHFIEAGLFDERLPAWQDFELFYRVIKRFGTARLIDVPSYLFDVSPRPDRISVQEQKIRTAYRIICEKHFADSPRDRQRLALQMFSDYYGIRPTLRDLARFSSEGRWIGGHLAMLQAALPRRMTRSTRTNKLTYQHQRSTKNSD